MRIVVLGVAVTSVVAGAAGCGEDEGRRVAPDTGIDQQPAALTNQTHALVAFHAIGNANGFLCQLDGAGPVNCSSPYQADVTDGDHSFQVTAKFNTAVDATAATAFWKVDTVAPDTTIVSGPPALDNSVAPELTFEGTDAGGAVTFECSLDDAAFTACHSPTTVPVTDGNRRYRVRAVDAAGNVDPSPATTFATRPFASTTSTGHSLPCRPARPRSPSPRRAASQASG